MAQPLSIMRIRKGAISNTFGMVRIHKDGTPKNHQGWDLKAHVGTPVFAICDGEIEFVTYNGHAGDYGKQICLKFIKNNHTYYAFYAHLSHIYVSKGAAVKEGTKIGLSGKTGNASNLSHSEEHLHFEIRRRPHLGVGLKGRMDPGYILGFGVYTCL